MAQTNFEKLRVYQLAEQLADLIWQIVNKWEYFPKITVGKQMVTAADGVGSNIAEGSGRGSYLDNRRFVKIARALCMRRRTGCVDHLDDNLYPMRTSKSSSQLWINSYQA